MILPPIRLLLVLAAGLPHTLGSESTDVPSDKAEAESAPNEHDKSLLKLEPLFLTPLIINCSYEEARERSIVQLFRNMGVNAHSGYITVNKTINVFFLLVVGERNSSDEPLLLWTQGGPGLSALFGHFLENGPFAITEGGNLTRRSNTLQKNMSVIYVDLPVGAGFSFTTNNASYAKNLEDIISCVMDFLNQFLQVFNYYENRSFYLGGESYGARYSVAVADYMLMNPGNVSLILKGVISGSGFLGPVLDIADSSKFLYQMSMVNEWGRDQFAAQFQKMKLVAANASIALYAVKMLSATIFTSTTTPTLFQNLTLFNDHASPFFTERPMIMYICVGLLNSTFMRQQLHVGNIPFQYNNPLLLESLAPDWLRDISRMVENVLNKSSMLFYMGQMDTLFPSVNQKAYLATLNWTYADEYRNASRELWSKPGKHYGADGFVKKVHNFMEALVLGMSHYGSAEKPDEAYYLIVDFVNSTLKNEKEEDSSGDAE